VWRKEEEKWALILGSLKAVALKDYYEMQKRKFLGKGNNGTV